jgi:hypothetical protein
VPSAACTRAHSLAAAGAMPAQQQRGGGGGGAARGGGCTGLLHAASQRWDDDIPKNGTCRSRWEANQTKALQQGFAEFGFVRHWSQGGAPTCQGSQHSRVVGQHGSHMQRRHSGLARGRVHGPGDAAVSTPGGQAAQQRHAAGAGGDVQQGGASRAAGVHGCQGLRRRGAVCRHRTQQHLRGREQEEKGAASSRLESASAWCVWAGLASEAWGELVRGGGGAGGGGGARRGGGYAMNSKTQTSMEGEAPRQQQNYMRQRRRTSAVAAQPRATVAAARRRALPAMAASRAGV